MMSKKIPAVEPQVARVVYPELKEDDTALYANGIQINHTPWDFALHFSQLLMPTTVSSKGHGLEIRGKSVVRVNIPVTLVRGLIKALQTNLEIYEKLYGKVEIPKEAKPKNGNGSVQ